MLRYKKEIIVTAFIVVGSIAAVLIALNKHISSQKIAIHFPKGTISASKAITPEQFTNGLGGTSNLGQNSGMLFIFNTPAKFGIWMRDMKYPIDIIWLSSSKTIVTIDQDVSPYTYPQTFYPSDNSKYVLEVNAGTAKRLDLSDGTKASF